MLSESIETYEKYYKHLVLILVLVDHALGAAEEE